jgi:magnesium chelatase subunit D
MKRPGFPFAAIAGQERMKTALLLNAIDPGIGGVLLRGQKGTAKSTAVRGLAAILPDIEVVDECPFSCDPAGTVLCPQCRERADRADRDARTDGADRAAGADRDQPHGLPTVRRPIRLVDLPLGATEDRVAGTLHLEQAIRHGKKAFDPGLLARAHRGLLYVDEVNLLPDHIADLILDAAASGVNVVEREGVSVRHPSRFILVGTMNPEEGELRPQLLDRFGLCVDLEAPAEPLARLAVVKAREAFDADPAGFAARHSGAQGELAGRILAARALLPSVQISDNLVRRCAELALEANAAGHRADIALRRTALALAALDGRTEVTPRDVEAAADYVLLHRARPSAPPPPPPEEEQEPEHDHDHPEEPDQPEESRDESEARETEDKDRQDPPESGQDQEPDQEQDPSGQEAEPQDTPPPPSPARESVAPIGETFRVKPIRLDRDRRPRVGNGRRSRSRTNLKSGRYVKARLDPAPTDLALDATLRAAAPLQSRRDRGDLALAVESGDLRRKVREKKVGNLILFMVDASGSMNASQRMAATKGAILSLLLDAYQKRDKVALVAFRGQEADLLLPPTGSVELAYRCLEELPTGGRTPLAHGLALGHSVLDACLRRDPGAWPLLVLISDGRANVSLSGGKPVAEALELASGIGQDERVRSLVIDVEKPGVVTFGLARELCARLGGRYFRIDDLKAADILDALKAPLAG